MQLFKIGYHPDIDVSILGFKRTDMKADIAEKNHQENRESRANFFINRQMRQVNRTENTGTEISYRCIKCRSCNTCKTDENLETVSVKEEIEQDLINNSVPVHTYNQMVITSLPFTHSPEKRLAPNKHKVEKVYKQQLRKLANRPKDKEQVLKSEEKLHQLGYVEYVR